MPICKTCFQYPIEPGIARCAKCNRAQWLEHIVKIREYNEDVSYGDAAYSEIEALCGALEHYILEVERLNSIYNTRRLSDDK